VRFARRDVEDADGDKYIITDNKDWQFSNPEEGVDYDII